MIFNSKTHKETLSQHQIAQTQPTEQTESYICNYKLRASCDNWKISLAKKTQTKTPSYKMVWMQVVVQFI
jgi:hypothetical protein